MQTTKTTEVDWIPHISMLPFRFLDHQEDEILITLMHTEKRVERAYMTKWCFKVEEPGNIGQINYSRVLQLQDYPSPHSDWTGRAGDWSMLAFLTTGFTVFDTETAITTFVPAVDLQQFKNWLSQCSSEDPDFNTYVAHVLREGDIKSWGAIGYKAQDPAVVQTRTQMYVQPTLNPYLVYAYH